MKLLKTLIILISLFVISFTLSLCNRVTYNLKWEAIFTENLEKESKIKSDTVNIKDYSIKVNLVHRKYKKVYADFAQNYCTYALTLAPHRHLDTVTNIEIFAKTGLSEINYSEKFLFKSEAGIYTSDSIGKSNFILQFLNYESSYIVSDFFLIPDTTFKNDFTGKFITKLYLTDKRVLTDTTNIINLKK